MKTYFIAGHSDFPLVGKRWEFWRVMNIDDKINPQDLITDVVKQLEESKENIRYISHGPPVVGELTITAFNQV